MLIGLIVVSSFALGLFEDEKHHAEAQSSLDINEGKLERITSIASAKKFRVSNSSECQRKTAIPYILHVTGKTVFMDPNESEWWQDWEDLNPCLTRLFWDDRAVSEFFQVQYPKTFYPYVTSGFLKPVEIADIFRYAVVETYGGYYADLDIEPLQPISRWLNISLGVTNTSANRISGIVGIEGIHKDAASQEFHSFANREQFCQWTFGFSKHHPFLERVLERVLTNLKVTHGDLTMSSPKTRMHKSPIDEYLIRMKKIPSILRGNPLSVFVRRMKKKDDLSTLLKTGPGVWSNEIRSYMFDYEGKKIMHSYRTSLNPTFLKTLEFEGENEEKKRQYRQQHLLNQAWEGIYELNNGLHLAILPALAFSSGLLNGPPIENLSLVRHHFRGSWKQRTLAAHIGNNGTNTTSTTGGIGGNTGKGNGKVAGEGTSAKDDSTDNTTPTVSGTSTSSTTASPPVSTMNFTSAMSIKLPAGKTPAAFVAELNQDTKLKAALASGVKAELLKGLTKSVGATDLPEVKVTCTEITLASLRQLVEEEELFDEMLGKVSDKAEDANGKSTKNLRRLSNVDINAHFEIEIKGGNPEAHGDKLVAAVVAIDPAALKGALVSAIQADSTITSIDSTSVLEASVVPNSVSKPFFIFGYFTTAPPSSSSAKDIIGEWLNSMLITGVAAGFWLA